MARWYQQVGMLGAEGRPTSHTAPRSGCPDHCQHQSGRNRSPDHLNALVCNGLKGHQTRKGGYPLGGVLELVFSEGVGVSTTMLLADSFTSGNGHPGINRGHPARYGAGKARGAMVKG